MRLFACVWISTALFAQTAPPPPGPPPPPAFMNMRGLPLTCFDRPNFEQNGLEFFVCNGGGGVAGYRKKPDARGIIYVRHPDIAMNLNMKQAKANCGTGRFGVRADSSGVTSFICNGVELRSEKFQANTRAPWAEYNSYLDR